MTSRLKFPNPFGSAHCVVLAFAHVARVRDRARYATTLARAARSAPRYTNGKQQYDARTGAAAGPRLLANNGFGYFSSCDEDVSAWAKLAGVTVGRIERFPTGAGPTLAGFARRTPGRWIVVYEVRGGKSRHALALVDGRAYGEEIQSRKRLVLAVEILSTSRNPKGDA